MKKERKKEREVKRDLNNDCISFIKLNFESEQNEMKDDNSEFDYTINGNMI